MQGDCADLVQVNATDIWRRAERLRRRIDQTDDIEVRQQLSKLAEECDLLADALKVLEDGKAEHPRHTQAQP